MKIKDCEYLRHKPVTLTKVSGAVYLGVLDGINQKKNKVCLTCLTIMQKGGGAWASPKHENVRWFSMDKVKSIVAK